jgi:hypothetical protein
MAFYIACDERQDRCAGVCFKTFAAHRNVSNTMLAILLKNESWETFRN